MVRAKFIGGDWGTTQLRLFLCGEDLSRMEQLDGPGANRVCGAFERALDALIRNWTERHGDLPIILSGMVGSSSGWVQTPYIPCPVKPEQLAGGCIQLRNGRIQIVPGVSCRNRLDAPDYMRGEETQLLGALQLEPALREGRHLVCLPGTHTKWAILQDGSVHDFLTVPTGEVYASLCAQTTLVPSGVSSKTEVSVEGFTRGATRVRQFPDVPVLHQMFESRSLRLSGELVAEQAASYLSGILIGGDVSGALRLMLPSVTNEVVHIIGATALCRLYSIALTTLNAEAKVIDQHAATLQGLAQVDLHLRDQRAS
jgi:2-dehydro-3-deoxygalactonokinase